MDGSELLPIEEGRDSDKLIETKLKESCIEDVRNGFC